MIQLNIEQGGEVDPVALHVEPEEIVEGIVDMLMVILFIVLTCWAGWQVFVYAVKKALQ